MPGTVAVIGGGLSGTLVVINLLRSAPAPLHILWFDRDGAFGRGLAYSTPHEYHLLNVRAAGMSLYPDDKDHFVGWLRQHHHRYTAHDFVPRKVFADYVQAELGALVGRRPQDVIETFTEDVKDLARLEQGFMIKAESGHRADVVVLALGNFPPAHPRTHDQSYTRSAHYFQNPFSPHCLPVALVASSVLLVGSGLTMIDMVLGLYHQGYKKTVTVISTHGYLPQLHSEDGSPAIPPFLPAQKPHALRDLLGAVNRALKLAKQEGYALQSVIDQVRPQVQAYWLHFSATEKKQFLRHLRHKWGVARHRVPAKSMAALSAMMERQQLQVIKGRISRIEARNHGFTVAYHTKSGAEQTLHPGCIVNCTGPESDYGALEDGLVKNLLAKGYISPDPLRYGIEAGPDGAIAPGLYTLGPPLKGILWESTAVPEIRVQARDLALKIIGN